MGADKVRVRVSGKRIDPAPLEQVMVQGELAASVVEFTLDKRVNGVDISALNYQMNGVNSRSQSAVNALLKGDAGDKDTFTLTWTVGEQFTAAPGPLLVWINATRSQNGKVVVNWESRPCRLFVEDGFILGDYVSVTEQLLIDLAELLGKAETAAANAQKSADTAAGSAGAAATSAREAAGSVKAAEEQVGLAKAEVANAAAQVGLAANEVKKAAGEVDKAAEEVKKAAGEVDKAAGHVEQARQAAEDAEASAGAAEERAGAALAHAGRAAESTREAERQALRAAERADEAAASRDQAAAQAEMAGGYVQEAQRIKDSTEMHYDVQENRVGFRRADEVDYTYTGDLTGPTGPQGTQGIQGPVGPTGPKGDRGESGLSVAADSLFLLYVSDEGDLIASYLEGAQPPNMYIDGFGSLIWETA